MADRFFQRPAQVVDVHSQVADGRAQALLLGFQREYCSSRSVKRAASLVASE